MGTINLNIEYLTYSNDEHLKDFECYGCKTYLNNHDLKENNYILGVREGGDIKREGGTPWDAREPSYNVIFHINGVEHKNCPQVQRCDNCMSRYREEEMRQSAKDKNWYCLKTCWRDHAELRRDAVPVSKRRKK